MGLRRGTTPTIPLTVDYDLTGYTVYVTFRSGGHEQTFTNERLTIEPGESTSISVPLTQEETLALDVGNAEIQVRAIKDGAAIATDSKSIDVGRILLDGVIDEL